MHLLALKYVGVILLTSQIMLPYAGVPILLYPNRAVMEDQKDTIQQTDAFFQQEDEVEMIVFELKENGDSLGTYELNVETGVKEIEETTIELIDDFSDYTLHTTEAFDNSQADSFHPVFVLRIKYGEQEEWIIAGEGFSYSDPKGNFELNIQKVTYSNHLEV
jgi:hypothetical protein